MIAFLLAAHQTKTVERYERTVISDRNLSLLQVENWPFLLVMYNEIE